MAEHPAGYGSESASGADVDSGPPSGAAWQTVASRRRRCSKGKVAAATLALCTYNANAWNSAAAYVSQQAEHEGPQIFMFQEHRVRRSLCDVQRDRIGRKGWSSVWEAAVQTKAGGWSSGVAT